LRRATMIENEGLIIDPEKVEKAMEADGVS